MLCARKPVRLLLFSAGTLLLPHTAEAKKPIVAVFSIQDNGVGLPAALLARLSDYLSSRLAATGAYQLVPRARLKRQLVEQKKESYKHCYDRECQIEIGKELAAQKTLSTSVMKLGSRCVVSLVLYDLRTSASEGGATAEGECSEDGLVGSIKGAVASISHRTGVAKPSSVKQGSLLVNSTPAGAAIVIDGSKKGWTPALVTASVGTHRLKLEKTGYEPQARKITIRLGTPLELSLKLKASQDALLKRKERQRGLLARQYEERLQEHRRDSRWGWIAFGTAVALAAGAGVSYGLSIRQGDAAHEEYRTLTEKDVLSEADRTEINEKRGEIESARTKLVIGTVLAGAATAAIAYSIYRFVTRPELRSTSRSTRTTRLTLAPAASGAGFSLTGCF